MTIEIWEFPKVNQVAQPSVQSPDSLGSATQSKLSHLRQQAYDEGYASGLEKSKNEQESVQNALEEQFQALSTFVKLLEAPLSHEMDVVAGRITELSIAIAKRLVGDAITHSPEVLVPLIQNMLNQLPISATKIQCYLNPQDLNLLKKDALHTASSSGIIDFLEDASLSRGGCRVISGYTEIDASIETRLQELKLDMPQANIETDSNVS